MMDKIDGRNSLLVRHSDCTLHEMGSAHPESPARISAILSRIQSSDYYSKLRLAEAPLINLEGLLTVHSKYHLEALMELSPDEGLVSIEADTLINPHSLNAARRAAGAAIYATEQVLAAKAKNAFCAIRPPGHHAESALSMGFCLFNNVALAAEKALVSGVSRVAIIDFDVHHGNGTVEIFKDRPEVLVCSSFQFPFYPGRFDKLEAKNICLTPLPEASDGDVFRSCVESDWRNAIRQHQPEMIFVSAGFDAHQHDPLGGLQLIDDDFLWATQLIKELADFSAEGRIVSLLEGGYNLDSLARCVDLHVGALVD